MSGAATPPEAAHRLLSQGLIAVIATEQPDGPPHLTPVWFAWTGTDFEIVTPDSSRKYRNLRRAGRCTVVVDKRTWPYQSVIAECELTDARLRRGYPRALVHRYLESDLAADFLDTYRDTELLTITLRPTRWYGHVNEG